MSKDFDLDPVLLNINSLNSRIPENLKRNPIQSYESQDSAMGDDFNDNFNIIDVIPQLDNYRRSLANTSKQRPTIELLHQSSFDDYLSVNLFLISFIVKFDSNSRFKYFSHYRHQTYSSLKQIPETEIMRIREKIRAKLIISINLDSFLVFM